MVKDGAYKMDCLMIPAEDTCYQLTSIYDFAKEYFEIAWKFKILGKGNLTFLDE